MTLNSRSRFSRKVVSRTGRTSTKEPGRNARREPMDTVNPPRTLPVMRPTTVSFTSWAFSKSPQAFCFFALSRLSRVLPIPSSSMSRVTSTSSPMLTSNSPSGFKNCHFGTTPSDFSPALTTTYSWVISITVPDNTLPGRISDLAKLSFNKSSKLSLMTIFFSSARMEVIRVDLGWV